MNTAELNKNIEKIPQEQRDGVLNIIDQKINNDMKEVIAEIRRLEDKFDTKFTAVESKFDTKFSAVESKFNTIFWILGIMATIILAIFGLLLRG